MALRAPGPVAAVDPGASVGAATAMAARPRSGAVETDLLGRIRRIDKRCAGLFRVDPGQVAGRFLLGFVDPSSQKQVLEMAFRARRTGEPVTGRCFVRPRMTLPTRCDVAISRVPAAGGSLRWRFSPLAEAAADAAAPSGVDAGEQATRRIARDLHDDAGQILAALHLAIVEVSRDLPEPARSKVRALRELVGTVEEQLRRITHEMRPAALERDGLAAALRSLAAGVTARTGVRVDVKGSFRERLQPDAEMHLYRVAQEALTNSLRHGAPSRVQVRLDRRGGEVCVSVADDGRGFDASAALAGGGRGLGLTGIRERVDMLGGTLSIQSRPGKGATLAVAVPLWP